MVTSEVYFTRFLYAQLTSLKFCSPRNEGFSMPPQGSLKFKECDLGMKLVTFFFTMFSTELSIGYNA